MIFKGLLEDARSIRDRDPAARTTLEVVLLIRAFTPCFTTVRRTGCTNTKAFLFLRVRCRSLRGI